MALSVRRRCLYLAAAGLLAGAAADPTDPNPDATIEIEELRVGLLVLGGSIGGGRLRFRGQEHAFSITGLGAGGLGVSSVRARGEVFQLERIEDFPGAYVEAQAAAVAGERSALQVRWLRNAKGVTLRLRSLREGVMLDISATGIVIELR